LEIGPLCDTQDSPGGWLKAICDTGAGLNIGNKPYHGSYRTKAPDLVDNYLDFTEEGLNPIIVGSVDYAGSKDCLKMKAIITYYMRYKLNTQPPVLQVNTRNTGLRSQHGEYGQNRSNIPVV
jgi:hypothetical protein